MEPSMIDVLLYPGVTDQYIGQIRSVEDNGHRAQYRLTIKTVNWPEQSPTRPGPENDATFRKLLVGRKLPEMQLFVTKDGLVCSGRISDSYKLVVAELDVTKNAQFLEAPGIHRRVEDMEGLGLFTLDLDALTECCPQVIITGGAE